MAGWIKLHRKILDWEWYDDPNTMRVFLHCLLRCNHKDNKWRGVLIKRGSFLTSFETLSKETGLSVSKIRTSVRKLKSTSEMTSSSHARYTVISILSYDSYQGDDKLNDNQIADSSQTLDKLLTTNKNEKNEKNEKKTIHQQADKESILLDGLSISEKAELVWKEYPRKLGKEKSINAIKRELKNRDCLEFIEIVRAFAKAKANTEKAFIPYGSTWFSNKGFNDDPEEWEDNKSKQSKPTTFTELTATAKSEQFSRNMQNPLY